VRVRYRERAIPRLDTIDGADFARNSWHNELPALVSEPPRVWRRPQGQDDVLAEGFCGAMGRAKKSPDEVMARAVRIALEGERIGVDRPRGPGYLLSRRDHRRLESSSAGGA
jgi:hypothetical protein